MIKKIKIEKLNPAAYNPRVHLQQGDFDYEKLKQSILTFGYIEPIVWNERTGNVVGGHQRLQVLRDLGEKEVEVSVVNLNEKDEKQLNLALNKVKGEWDYNKLEKLLKEFSYEEINATGFSADEIALLFEDEFESTEPNLDWAATIEDTGKSYVATLKFSDIKKAIQWAEKNGMDGQIKTGTKTTVIRVEE